MESFTISELAREFGVTPRTIRFYEEKKLISPLRSVGNQRRYGKRDRTRLKLVLRGKKFGMRLDEIEQILGMADYEFDEAVQIQRALEHGKKSLEKIQSHIKELQSLELELSYYEQKCLERLKQLGADNGNLSERH